MQNYEYMNLGGAPIKAWTKGLTIEPPALAQLENVSRLPFIFNHLAVMPDVHMGFGASVGTVIATKGAVIPSAVGVDIGCGMCAVQTTLTAKDLPDSLAALRTDIERAVPHGFVSIQGRSHKGGWVTPPASVCMAWNLLATEFDELTARHPKLLEKNPLSQLGTLGGGNHFIELCLDEGDNVWVMLHSGSRGIGNMIGQYFIELAKQDMRSHFINLPDRELAYFPVGTQHFEQYWMAMNWAQDYARANRFSMLSSVLSVMHAKLPAFSYAKTAINCHHNYATIENHYGSNVFITRKGAVNARQGALGIIPGSMGAKSFIVEGRGNPESFHSCSHGAGRSMSRTEAKRRFTLEDHAKATAGVECRKDADVIDETPQSYKDIDKVMAAQTDLVKVLHTLKQVLCVKG